jgi:hypothetical protein
MTLMCGSALSVREGGARVTRAERERADAKLGRAGRALASGVKGWAGVESGSWGEGERKEVGLMGFLGRLWV